MTSFNYECAIASIFESRRKPWEDQELHIIDGMKFFCFLFTTTGQTGSQLLFTKLIDLIQSAALLQTMYITAFYQGNLAIDSFVLFSAFLTSYRSFQIMEARQSVLSFGDIMKIYVRKFVRIAPIYYLMWLCVWGLTSRWINGPLSFTANEQYDHCSD